MSKLIVTMLLLVGMLVGGCAKEIQRIPFPIEEYNKLPKKGTGTATVRGQVFMRDKNGKVRYGFFGMSARVTITPITSYSIQDYNIIENWDFDKEFFPPLTILCDDPKSVDKRIWEYIDIVPTNTIGQFEFGNVPAGEYYLSSFVVWQDHNIITRLFLPLLAPLRGKVMSEKITIKDGEDVRITLTR